MRGSQEWRYQYFNGWLPLGEVFLNYSFDPGMKQLLDRIDARKIEIAKYVRAKYPRHMLEPDRN